MNTREQAEVLQYLEKFNGVISELTQSVLHRLVAGTKVEVNPLLNSDRVMELLSRSVKMDPCQVLQVQMEFMEKHLCLWQKRSQGHGGQ